MLMLLLPYTNILTDSCVC